MSDTFHINGNSATYSASLIIQTAVLVENKLKVRNLDGIVICASYFSLLKNSNSKAEQRMKPLALQS